ncbi:conserved hypothetical protein [Streptomyces himastatinicus ATCC 53653]|uniref:Uncharacterized protein n=1 Tax=Streptomyces himastatinicus ATCC 53653 TaxID=457427 RepID=D9WVU5_9ACTN|nr:hypothetical protein [Streptomyces himastatinicus]EFL24454.1 conserved hypothetical protein [Streptomyces himastatinicus ATCC 53653]
MIKPEEIPQYTGNLELLEKAHGNLKRDAGHIRDTGADVHTHFQGLSAYYKAPEAERLFATTKPVKDRADTFADDLGKVSTALSEYATEIRPLVTKLTQLKTDATQFVNDNKDDDDWEYDEDKVDEHNQLRDDITATVAAFWAAERTCHNKITALFGGTQMVAGDGSKAKNQYGFNADDLKNAKLPWGDPVEEKHHAWEVGHWVKSFVWDGVIVDGVWGTIKGLGTLVGVDGWDAMGKAWKGLAQLGTGLAISAIPGAREAFWSLPDDKLPSWLRDSRNTMKQTGKALVAWDEWGKNPGRAAGAVTFNVVTTVFTGGAGGAASGAGKAGAVAKALSATGKAGRVIDPMTYVGKGVGAGLSKIGDIAKGLKGIQAIEIPKLPDGTIKLPEGTVRLPDGTVDLPEGAAIPEGAAKLPDGTVKLPDDVPALPEGTTKLPTDPGKPARYYDPDGNFLDEHGNVLDSIDNARKEDPPNTAPATDTNAPDPTNPAKQPALVGAGARTTDNAAHIRLGNDADNIGRAGDDLPGGNTPGSGAPHPVGGSADNMPHASHNSPDSGGTAHTPGAGAADNAVTGGSHADVTPGGGGHADVTPGGGHAGPPPSRGGNGPGIPHQGGGRADIGGPPHGTTWADHGVPEPRNPHTYTAAERQAIMDYQVKRANNDLAYRKEYYQKNGYRIDVDRADGTNVVPPQLVEVSGGGWKAKSDLAPPLKPEYLDDIPHQEGPKSAGTATREKLDGLADVRRQANTADRPFHTAHGDARKAYKLHGTDELKALLDEAAERHREPHAVATKANEAYGEAIAREHAIPQHYPKADEMTLHGPKNGKDQFDQVYKEGDRYIVVEAKSHVDTPLGERRVNGVRHSQGSREYFLDILKEMKKRRRDFPSEGHLATELRKALDEGRLDYVVVKGQDNPGKYTGYTMQKFDIREPS